MALRKRMPRSSLMPWRAEVVKSSSFMDSKWNLIHELIDQCEFLLKLDVSQHPDRGVKYIEIVSLPFIQKKKPISTRIS